MVLKVLLEYKIMASLLFGIVLCFMAGSPASLRATRVLVVAFIGVMLWLIWTERLWL